eukprot:TRINITY_DN6806_c0_g1_i1.p1 TRINITY_DN6806_c0_g1~~TRINITY_DN6806_c0_g1_i1.p1  ORF type:complete len:741 (+),score=252.57 TRINITY_DN6806_c0_g1_i1:70-2223(+)
MAVAWWLSALAAAAAPPPPADFPAYTLSQLRAMLKEKMGIAATKRDMDRMDRCVLQQSGDMAAVSPFQLLQAHMAPAGEGTYALQPLPNPITGFGGKGGPHPSLGSAENCKQVGGTFCYATVGSGRNLAGVTSSCVPKNCTAGDLAAVVHLITKKMHKVPKVHCVGDGAGIDEDGAAQNWAGLLISLAVVVVMATCVCRALEFHAALRRSTADTSPRTPTKGAAEKSALLPKTDAAASPATSSRTEAAPGRSSVRAFFGSFDLAKALDAVLAAPPAGRPTNFLDGMRVLSISWVVLCHTLVYAPAIMPGWDNRLSALLPLLDGYRSVLLTSGVFAVDTFFFMSGFLAVYLFLSEKNLRMWAPEFAPLQAARNVLLTWVGRYARLTPLYATVLFSCYYLLEYIVDTPYSASFRRGGFLGGKACEEYSYLNMLYVQNLASTALEKGCFYHSWYLAVDMQFLIVASLLMVGYIYAALWALVATGALGAASLVSVVVITDDPRHVMGHDLYTLPYSRCTPYIYGMATAYILRRAPDRVRAMVGRGAVRAVMYLLAAALLWGNVTLSWACYRMGYEFAAHGWTLAQARAYQFFYHFGWGLGLGLLTVCWVNGHGGAVRRFLAAPAWAPLAKLTFGVYLTHPIVMVVLVTGLEQGPAAHYTDVYLLTVWTASLVGAFLAAFVCFLFVERPAGELYTWFLTLLLGRTAPKPAVPTAPSPPAETA